MIYPKLLAAKAADDYMLLLEFSGDQHRIYDFKPNLTHRYYRQLSDPALFARVSVIDGEIEWATGQDFCPHTLYEQSRPL